MDASTALVCVVALALIYRLIRVALHLKGDLKAGVKVGPGTFFVEVHEKKRGSPELRS